MTASPLSPEQRTTQWSTSPVIEYEPVPQPHNRSRPAPDQTCPTPSTAALHRPSLRPLRGHHVASRPCEPPAPRSAVVFAETALLQVIEVIDRRRPVAQLRPLMTPVLVDRVITRVGATRSGSAQLRRVRVRSVDPGAGEVTAAEVFASFSRSGRVHAVAGRIERHRDRWRIVALQIG
jgi:hypothetical protein